MVALLFYATILNILDDVQGSLLIQQVDFRFVGLPAQVDLPRGCKPSVRSPAKMSSVGIEPDASIGDEVDQCRVTPWTRP